MRAINVAGHPIIKMLDVRNSLAAAGVNNVRTYIQSGNVIFDCPQREFPVILRKVHETLRTLIGVEPRVFVRTLNELERIVGAAPFKDFQTEAKIKLYVAFHKSRARYRNCR